MAKQRLLAYSKVAGNDFGSFEGIGPVKAATIALRPIPRPLSENTETLVADMACLGWLTERIVENSPAEDTAASRREILDTLQRITYMFQYPIVWDPIRGCLAHRQDLPSNDLNEAVTKHTGN